MVDDGLKWSRLWSWCCVVGGNYIRRRPSQVLQHLIQFSGVDASIHPTHTRGHLPEAIPSRMRAYRCSSAWRRCTSPHRSATTGQRSRSHSSPIRCRSRERGRFWFAFGLVRLLVCIVDPRAALPRPGWTGARLSQHRQTRQRRPSPMRWRHRLGSS